ncbi:MULTISPECIES: hypothetical protein [unclassified Siphonobacter]|nr:MULTISPECIES: hypothetical protein [unclassified Siphonobacter]MDQ1088881.1 hypothetical protein [Siphonobacter sp. SORGH_AS_1065]MDR6195065.1 hypothetical protein [Siphonobacter sp. SORGH_AS_0500]PKK38594.1 hypothetical protein BWI96_01090 [Siphonobacter sp. SORGH_AS_0500]
MQLSLLPSDEQRYFLDLFAQVVFDTRRNRPRLKTICSQRVPGDLAVSCPARLLNRFPEGTIYKLDAKLVQLPGKQPYLVAVNRRNMQRALEFYDHNRQLQNGIARTRHTSRNKRSSSS